MLPVDSLSQNKQNPSNERHDAAWKFPSPCEENTRYHKRKCEKANLDDNWLHKQIGHTFTYRND